MEPKKRQFKGGDVEAYVTQHADRPLHIADVAREIGWSVNSTSSRLCRMLEEWPNRMERVRRGVYRWNSTPITAVAGRVEVATAPLQAAPARNDDQVMTVSVVSRDEATGVTLVRDDATHDLYTMKPFKIR